MCCILSIDEWEQTVVREEHILKHKHIKLPYIKTEGWSSHLNIIVSDREQLTSPRFQTEVLPQMACQELKCQ